MIIFFNIISLNVLATSSWTRQIQPKHQVLNAFDLGYFCKNVSSLLNFPMKEGGMGLKNFLLPSFFSWNWSTSISGNFWTKIWCLFSWRQRLQIYNLPKAKGLFTYRLSYVMRHNDARGWGAITRIWKFIYCDLLLLYLSNHRLKKIIYQLRK